MTQPAIDATMPDGGRLDRHLWARRYLVATVRRSGKYGQVLDSLARLELVLDPAEATHIREVWESITAHTTAWAEAQGHYDLDPDGFEAVAVPRLVELLSFPHPTELLPAVDEPMQAVVAANLLLGAEGHPSRWFESDLVTLGDDPRQP